MLIIPVIDLYHGIVVHAKGGQRRKYQPLESILTNSHDIYAVLDSYLKLYSFKIIYIADLDAIEHSGNHFQTLETLAQRYQECQFWVDVGTYALMQPFTANNIRFVIGTESQFSADRLSLFFQENEAILSVDYINADEVKNQHLLDQLGNMPRHIITMMLYLVGSRAGIQIHHLPVPDKNESRYYYAGGVRNITDISRLSLHGFYGTLVASAIHAGMITREDITTQHTTKGPSISNG